MRRARLDVTDWLILRGDWHINADHQLQIQRQWTSDCFLMHTLPAGFQIPVAWKTGLESGATVILHGVLPEQSELVSGLANTKVTLCAQPYGMWEGRAYRNGFTALTPGLSQLDLYLKNYDGWEGAVSQAEQPKYKIEDIIYWSAAVSGAVEHVFPGGLIELPVGRSLPVDWSMRKTTTLSLSWLAASRYWPVGSIAKLRGVLPCVDS